MLPLTDLVCLIAGVVIAGLVQLFKDFALVSQYPKVAAAVLSVLTAVVSGLTIGSLDWVAIAQCTIVPFATAIATYEVGKTATT